jgi:hypothetical protein
MTSTNRKRNATFTRAMLTDDEQLRKELDTLNARWWGRGSHWNTISNIVAYGTDDFVRVHGTDSSLAPYLEELILKAGYRLEAEVVEEQRAADAEIVQEVFENVPEDHVLSFFAEELAQDILDGEPNHKRFEDG